MPTEKPRISIVLEEDTLKAVDHYRYINGYRSTSKAVLALIQRGLTADVPLSSGNGPFKLNELQLLTLYRRANEDNKARILNIALKSNAPKVKLKRYFDAEEEYDDTDAKIDLDELNCFLACFPYMPVDERNHFLTMLIKGREDFLDSEVLESIEQKLEDSFEESPAEAAARKSTPRASDEEAN